VFIEVQNVSKAFRGDLWERKVMAVSSLSFTVADEGIVGFVGPNGAGKTTTIKMLLGLVRPDKGRVCVCGSESSEPRSREQVAFVSEQPYFYAHLTLRECLRFVGDIRGMDRGTVEGEAKRVLDVVGLTMHSGKRVGQLSKGMQQRLNMAQALMGDPKYFVFDEPMSGMDPPGRSLFRRIFRDLRVAGKTVFFSTHILEDVETLCNRVIVLSKGERTYDGSVEELLQKGFEGTELTVRDMNDAAAEQLRTLGCEVSDLQGGRLVFARAGSDVRAVQDVLARQGLYCDSIAQRRKSLETLLYAQEVKS